VDNERRAQLLGTKLRALIVEKWSHADLSPVPYFAGAALKHDVTDTVFVFVDAREIDADPLDLEARVARPVRGWLGGAILAATRANATALVIIADAGTLDGHDVRRAKRSGIPASVFSATLRELTELRMLTYVPSALPSDAEMAFVNTIREAGAVPIVEDATLKAEVLGLEVGRVTTDEFGVRLEVGVGRHDRLAQSMMNAHTEPVLALRAAVETVLEHRASNRSPHPANTVSRARWLREHLMSHPELVGVALLERIPGTVVVELKRATVAIAGNADVVIGCSVGADLDALTDLLDAVLDAVPSIAVVLDVVSAVVPSIKLVVPIGDDLPAVRELCAAVRPAVELITITPPWV
jgi:hypothetical protein